MALVIGNGSYEALPELPPALHDADKIGNALESMDFEVIVAKDLDKVEFERVLREFEASISSADVALFYYSGHGVQATVQQGGQFDTNNFLVPVSSNIATVEDIPNAAIDLNEVHAVLQRQERDFNFVILDACSDSRLQARDGSRPQGLARPDPATNTLVALAAGENQLAFTGGENNSIYTGELLRHIGERGAEIQEIFARTRKGVENTTFGNQVPVEISRLKGSFYFKPRAHPNREQYPPGEHLRDPKCPECPLLVVLPPGSFQMGSDRSDSEQPVHQVTIDLPFAIGKFEVTLEEYGACVADGACRAVPNNGGLNEERLPAGTVRWEDTQDYVRWLSGETGNTYRLPSEAEWEYAARAGTETPYPWGESAERKANCRDCDTRWSGIAPAPVGSFSENAFKLHDMNGNVWEWVSDCAHDSYEGAPDDGTPWITGFCAKSVIRGGSFRDPAFAATSSFRTEASPAQERADFGFRVVRVLRQ
ncbi:MAG: SUMF1/EgtB/PvdO family nonheme iron enzyme [Pseudomonadota bacterium]